MLDWISEEEPNYGVLFKVPTGTNNQDYVEITPRLRLEYSEPPAGLDAERAAIYAGVR